MEPRGGRKTYVAGLGPVGYCRETFKSFSYLIRIHIWYVSKYILRGLTIRLKSISSDTYISRSTVSLSYVLNFLFDFSNPLLDIDGSIKSDSATNQLRDV